MILFMGFYGSFNLQLGPNCSFLIKANPFFVNSIKAQQIKDRTAGLMLYGFNYNPLHDVQTTWSICLTEYLEPESHKEWAYYLNAGSRVDVSYDVKSPSSASLSLIIAQGRDSLLHWIHSPVYPNTTMSWNIVYGSGKITQAIQESDTYYVGVANVNLDKVEVYMNITIKSLLYNTSNASFKCLLRSHVCSFKLMFLNPNAVVLTTSGSPQVKTKNDYWFIQISFGPQWITYFGGSCLIAAVVLVLFRCYSIGSETRDQGNVTVTDREPLLSPKNNDHSNWGSSYDSIPSEEDQGVEEKMISKGSFEGKEAEIHSQSTRRLCAICFDSPRDCFFLPCGHCAACFSCGSRIAEEAGTCPICRRKMKKVRKIIAV
ncbi:E3 ubiquitin-protein ligase APD2-like isoform X2 [Amaranthus tricolor]|nr:E3 ubiquitin-protein ligase APD2-like isoform X2 [Amaranthus tricolor]